MGPVFHVLLELVARVVFLNPYVCMLACKMVFVGFNSLQFAKRCHGKLVKRITQVFCGLENIKNTLCIHSSSKLILFLFLPSLSLLLTAAAAAEYARTTSFLSAVQWLRIKMHSRRDWFLLLHLVSSPRLFGLEWMDSLLLGSKALGLGLRFALS